MVIQLNKSNYSYYTNRVGSTTQYLQEISKYEILSDEQIKEELLKAQKGDKKAISNIVNSNQRFVFSVAKRFSGGNNDLICDLISEGNIGLIKAIEYFKIYKDNYFLTYAVYWIQRQMFLYLTFVSPLIKVSNKAKTTKVEEIKNRYIVTECRMPTSEEIIKDLKDLYDIDIVNQKDIYDVITTSIDSDFIKDNSEDFSNFYALDNNCDQDKISHKNDYENTTQLEYEKTLISKSLGVLSDKERKVVELLYGINSYREHEMQEIADIIGITYEGVRLTNKRALKKLKNEIEIVGYLI